MSKLNLNFELVEKARKSARNIANNTQEFIDKHTTVAVERTVCRLLGIDGVDKFEVPLPNVVVENIVKGNGLGIGAAYYIGNAMVEFNLTPQEIAEKVANNEIDLIKVKENDLFEIKLKINEVAKLNVEKIRNNRNKREEYLEKYGDKEGPYLYIIVATGNIYEDIVQAKAAAKQGADIIAVIRTTGQSLLDYVPYGATTEGFGGTYATGENFRLMREALDEVGEEEGRYIRLCNYCSGLCMPEIAALGAQQRLDVMLNDALYGILFRDINMKRTMIDQYFSRIINGFAGVIINTGEDNYLTTADAVEEAHTVLASQFINEQFALAAGLPEEQMGLGHAFEISPDVKNGFLYELSQAQMAREIFPKAPLKYMPPTKFMTGDIFKGQVQDALFNMVTIMTNQKLHLLGMLTEAIHTPFISDRAISIENAQYIFNTMSDLGEEIEFKNGGIIQGRANEVLNNAYELLHEIEKEGLFKTLEQGKFAGIKRPIDGGKGLDGVVIKENSYFNPFVDLMLGGQC
ncbi:MAG: lysine 5,6-aminomutase subunit alpha [Peptostreptococcaceae bacterium]